MSLLVCYWPWKILVNMKKVNYSIKFNNFTYNLLYMKSGCPICLVPFLLAFQQLNFFISALVLAVKVILTIFLVLHVLWSFTNPLRLLEVNWTVWMWTLLYGISWGNKLKGKKQILPLNVFQHPSQNDCLKRCVKFF